jgi:hypothetical protein
MEEEEMKIYIVTSGEYDDYRIRKCFTDKPKAEYYQSICPDANEIEEYETADSLDIKPKYIAHLCYNKDNPNYHPWIEQTTTVDNDTYETMVWFDNRQMGIIKVLNDDIEDKEKYILQLNEVCETFYNDAMAMLEKGMHKCDICDQLKERADNFII